jgi:uncharacterized membrane protein
LLTAKRRIQVFQESKMAQQIELEAAPLNLRVSKGGSVESSLTMRNRGQTVDQFTISIEGIDPGWYTLPVSSVALFPNDQDKVKIVIHLPEDVDLKQNSYVIKAKVTSQENPAVIAAIDINLEVETVPNLSLDISPPRLSGNKGAYQLSVNNPGSKDANVILKAGSSSSRLSFSFQPEKVAASAGKKTGAVLNVKLNWIGLLLWKKTYDFRISVEPVDGSLKTPVSENGALTSVPWYTIFSKIRLPWISRPPVIKTFEVTTDNKRDFQIKWLVKRAKSIRLNEEDVAAKGEQLEHPSESKQYILTAENKNGAVSKTLEVQPLTVPQARTSEKIKVTLSASQLQAQAGMAPALLTVQVQNLSDIVDKFTVEVEGLDESWYSRSASSIALMPKTTEGVRINFLPPKKKGVRAGIHPFAVTVRSQSTTGESAVTLGQIEVLPATDLKIKINPYRITAVRKGSYRVNLSNVNVSDANVVLTASDLDEGCRFTFAAEKLMLRAWNTIDVPLIIRSKKGSIIGEIKRYDITVTANIEGAASPLTANCEFNHKPVMKDWRLIWRIIKIVISLAIVLLAVYFVLKMGGGFSALKDNPQTWLKNFIDTISSWIPK